MFEDGREVVGGAPGRVVTVLVRDGYRTPVGGADVIVREGPEIAEIRRPTSRRPGAPWGRRTGTGRSGCQPAPALSRSGRRPRGSRRRRRASNRMSTPARSSSRGRGQRSDGCSTRGAGRRSRGFRCTWSRARTAWRGATPTPGRRSPTRQGTSAWTPCAGARPRSSPAAPDGSVERSPGWTVSRDTTRSRSGS